MSLKRWTATGCNERYSCSSGEEKEDTFGMFAVHSVSSGDENLTIMGYDVQHLIGWKSPSLPDLIKKRLVPISNWVISGSSTQ